MPKETDTKARILTACRRHGALRPDQIASIVGIQKTSTGPVLRAMVRRRLLCRFKRVKEHGFYYDLEERRNEHGRC